MLPVAYGRCPCSGAFTSRTVEVRIAVGGRTVHMEDVPQGACPDCGTRVYRPDVLERLESLMHAHTLGPRDEVALRPRDTGGVTDEQSVQPA